MESYRQEVNRTIEGAGKLIVKDMLAKGVNVESLKEGLRLSESFRTREDITTSNASALYVTALASVIRAAVEPNMVGLELLQLNTDLMNGGGKGSIQLPKEQRVTAAEIGEGGSVSYTGVGYTSITVTPTPKVAASRISWLMVKRGMVSMITAEAARLGKALARKVDSDIISGIEAVCTSGNSNRLATGGSATRVSYNDLITARSYVEGYDVGGFKATHVVIHPDDYAALMKDTDFKNALWRAPIVTGTGGTASVAVFPQAEFFGPQKIIQTAQVTSGTTLFTDSTELGTFVQETDVEVVDGRINGTIDTEVIAVQSYGIGIQNVRAASSVVMAAS